MSIIKVPKNSIIKDSFLNLIDKAVVLWEEMDVRASRGTKIDFLSFLYERNCFEKIRELKEFENLCDNLQREITYFDDLFLSKEAVEKALRDYLLVTGRGDHDSGDFYEEPAGKDEAIRLLLEDVYLKIPPTRGFVWISGILPQKTVIKIDEQTRIRRATRFELRAMEQNPPRYWDWEIPEKTLLPLHLPAVQSAYMIEVKIEPSDVSLIPEIPRKPLETKIVERLLECFRLLWDSPFSLDSSYFLFRTKPNLGFSKEYIRREYGQSKRLIRLIDGDEDINYRDRSPLVFDKSEQNHLIQFWNSYLHFMDSPRNEFHTDFDRANLRYNQSFTEPYFEDVALDLALALEAILRTGWQSLPYLAAILVAPSSDISAIQDIISKFNLLRNKVAHGTTLSLSDIGVVRKIETVVRTCLRNIVHLHPFITEKRQNLRSILNNCLLNCEARDEIVDKIPDWSRM